MHWKSHSPKRYIVFIFDVYYPSGGLRDIDSSYDSFEEASAYATSKIDSYHDFIYIVDRDTWDELEIKNHKD